MQRDLILGLLRTDLLQRLAFLVEKMAPRWTQSPTDDAAAFCDILRLLTALGRHSRTAAHRIVTHRRLLRALLPLCSGPPVGDVLQERRRLALRLQRALCRPSASLCRSQVSSGLCSRSGVVSTLGRRLCQCTRNRTLTLARPKYVTLG